MFLDGPGTKARDAVHILFAGEKVRPDALGALPEITDSELPPEAFRVVTIEGLVRMKLISFRLNDQVHLQDMIEVGLIDQTWRARFAPELAARLQQILDTPEG